MSDWIIGVCSSGAEGVILYRFRGTTDEVKQKIVEMILQDKANDKENWEWGYDDVDSIQDICNSHEFYGVGCYSDYHIDYAAKEFSMIEFA